MKAYAPLLCLFVKCLQFLPNLHTLEIWGHNTLIAPLEVALKRVELPQIKTLILPPTAYPILRHCRDVEDVVYVVGDKTRSSHELVESLASNQNSKVKGLAIPLISWPNASRK